MIFRTRFAPSPTGPLHLGHAYSALIAHDSARAAGGEFLLRIDDIDQSRARDHWEDQLKDDLTWLGITWDGPFHKMSLEQWQKVIAVDLDSAFNVTRQVWEGMRTRGFGRVINISSINGQKGQFGQVNYSAAKAGLIGFTKALAQEGAKKGITVNVVCPGYIDTEMVRAVPEKVLENIIATVPVGRLGKAEEIASMCTYLASDEAAFITGARMTVNGAQYIAS